MNKTMKVLFLLRTRANYESGPTPIYMRVTIEGERFEFATQRKADPEKWDSKASRLVKSKKEETRQLNNHLDMLQMKVFEAHRELLTIGEEITAKKVRNLLLGIENDDSKTLLGVYREHIEEIKALLGKEYAPGTLLFHHLRSFITKSLFETKKSYFTLYCSKRHPTSLQARDPENQKQTD